MSFRAERGICTLLLLATHAAAQEPTAHKPTSVRPPLDSLEPVNAAAVDSAYQRQRHARCWRARPMPDCRMVFLTDIGIDVPLYTTPSGAPNPSFSKSFPARLNWSLGLMRNGERHSHGVSIALTSENLSHAPQIIEYRYRNWLGPGSALDAGVGWKRNEVWQGTGLVPGQGMTFLFGYTPTRWIGATLRYDFVNAAGRTHRGVLLGVQSTRLSEYLFQGLALAIVDGLLARIGFERDTDDGESR